LCAQQLNQLKTARCRKTAIRCSRAHAHLRTEFNQIKMKVLVLDRAELEALTSTDDLALKLRQKYGAFKNCELVLGALTL
jgi:hypothetical protein